MPFVFKKILNHGTSNPIVARLSLQILTILRDCNLPKETQDQIGELYLNSLQKKLLRCWEVKERFREEFNAAVAAYKLPEGQAIEVPQIGRLEEECHNFLYEAKNFIRDALKVFNGLYGTDFREASEFSRARKGGRSLIELAASTFGAQDPKTQFLQEAASDVEYFIGLRNAVEHPGGFSGELRIENFSLEPDGKIAEPTWHTEKDGKPIHAPSSIRADMETALHNLLLLAEDIFVSWAADHLRAPEFMRIALVPEERRDPKCPIKWVVTASQALEAKLAELENRRR